MEALGGQPAAAAVAMVEEPLPTPSEALVRAEALLEAPLLLLRQLMLLTTSAYAGSRAEPSSSGVSPGSRADALWERLLAAARVAGGMTATDARDLVIAAARDGSATRVQMLLDRGTAGDHGCKPCGRGGQSGRSDGRGGGPRRLKAGMRRS